MVSCHRKLGPSLNQDCGILTIYLTGVSDGKTKPARMGHFIIGESSNDQTPSSENQQTNTATRIHRDRTPPLSFPMQTRKRDSIPERFMNPCINM